VICGMLLSACLIVATERKLLQSGACASVRMATTYDLFRELFLARSVGQTT